MADDEIRIRETAKHLASNDYRPAPLERIASALERIASALERGANRLDQDATMFSEMVKKGRGLSA